ncbi:MAG TPA: serine/threonine-protein kinase [Mycobacteriales bacterium]|nr:serine/threonine-protein kinase [Mycobacteriales bacterium]
MSAPDRFGRYRVVRRIGSGAFATVWLARDEVLQAPVAVKVLADNWASRLDVRERFEEEARILRRADSDRVVRVHDIGELEDGRPYFVMTYADRGTLADRLRDGPIPVGEALRYGADIARGLAVLHQVGVIHRDVNPGNVLLRSGPDGTERVLIADLGLAKAAARGSGFTLTVGTPGYTAPEQARPGDTPLDRRADVYSIGAVLHHMLTGVAPKQDEPPAPLPPEVPAVVADVVRQALAPLPGDRYPSAGALADALDAAAVRARSLPGAQVLPYQPPDREDNERIFRPDPVQDTLTLAPPPRRHRSWLVPLLVVLVLAGAGTAAAVLVRERRPVTVTTADGAIRLRVPPSWAAQERRTPWDLGPYGGGTGVALVVAPSVTGWADSTGPGVFAGRADGVAPAALLARSLAASCPADPSRPLAGSGLTGTLTRRVCGSTAYVEAVLQPPDRSFSVYVQVKEAASGGTADSVIRSLVVNWS